MFWKRFRRAHEAGRYFNQANEHWREHKQHVLEANQESADNSSLEVIRLCQLAIESDERMGDAYILLANALMSIATRLSEQAEANRREFLLTRAAAVIHFWHSLPYRDYPISKNARIGEQLWETAIQQLRHDNCPSERAVPSLSDSYRDSLAPQVISPRSYAEIKGAVFGTASRAETEHHWLQEPAEKTSSPSRAEILEEMCHLDATSRISLRRTTRLTHAEANILSRKANPLFGGSFSSRVFPITENTDETEIHRWLNHPMVNVPLPDTFVMNMAAHTAIPAVTMERILRKLLQDDYDMHRKIAEERVRSKKRA